jgi:hypothetical protein
MQRHDIENTVQVPFLSGLADHLRECYGVRSGKSMYGLTASRTPP